MNLDDGSPFMMALWLWLLLAPVAGVLLDLSRMKRDVRHRRPALRDDDRRDEVHGRGVMGGMGAMPRPAGGVSR